MKKDELKELKELLNENRLEDKRYFFGAFLLLTAVFMLFATTNILFRVIIAGLAGQYGWLLLKKTRIAEDLPDLKKK